MKKIVKNIVRGMSYFGTIFLITFVGVAFLVAPATLSGLTGNSMFYFLYIPHILVLFYYLGKED